MTAHAHPAAPPTDRHGFVAPPPRPVWPTVIGILAIVFGSFGVLGAAWGLLMSFLMEWFFTSMGMPAHQVAAQLEAMRALMGWSVALSVLSLGLAAMLLVGGIQLLRRRRQAVTLCRVWAVAKMLLVVGGVVLGYVAHQLQMEAVSGQQQVATNAAMSNAMAAFNALIGLAWGWALPVFLLIWFSLSFVKREVAQWL